MSWHEIWQMSLRKVGVFDVCMCFISTISYKSFIWNCAPCSNFWLVYEYLLRNCAFLCTLSSRLIKQLRGNKYIAVPVRYNWKSWFIAPCIMKRMDDSSYRRNFDPCRQEERSPLYQYYHSWKEHLKMSKIAQFGREICCKMRNIALWSSQILYIFALRAGTTIFQPKVVIFTARNTNIYKICELHRAIFSSFYNISQPNFAVLLIRRCFF
jgi:hypothetical protein